MFICVLCNVQTVGFEKSANAFDAKATSASSFKRIQRFFAQSSLDSDINIHYFLLWSYTLINIFLTTGCSVQIRYRYGTGTVQVRYRYDIKP